MGELTKAIEIVKDYADKYWWHLDQEKEQLKSNLDDLATYEENMDEIEDN